MWLSGRLLDIDKFDRLIFEYCQKDHNNTKFRLSNFGKNSSGYTPLTQNGFLGKYSNKTILPRDKTFGGFIGQTVDIEVMLQKWDGGWYIKILGIR